METKDLTLSEFCKITASKEPTPGGGSVAALTGALGCALSEMVANLTLGKKAYADFEEEMKNILTEGESIRTALLSLIDTDCAAYGAYMAALALPKGTEYEKANRAAALRDAAVQSAVAPLRTARCAMRIFPLAKSVIDNGNKNAVTDALMSAILARAAVRSAILNVRINLPSLDNPELSAALESECAALESAAAAYENDLLASSEV